MIASYLYVIIGESLGRIKLVVFDMDNVIFDEGYFEEHARVAASSWQIIWNALGAQEENERLKKKWAGGGYKNYMEWQEEALMAFQKRGLTREKYFELIEGIPFMKGAKETVAEIRKRGILTAIISGSFFELALRARMELGIDFPLATCSMIFDGNSLKGWSVLPFDFEGKLPLFNALSTALKVDPKDCAFVCDGVNDIDLAKGVGLPIAFGARDDLKRCCKVIVDSGDLRDILKYIY